MIAVIKRDGTRVPFDKNKIINAVDKAFLDVDGVIYENDTAIDIANDIEAELVREDYASVEQIQDLVENYLMRSDRLDVAKSYICYRYKRQLSRAMQKDLNNRYTHIKDLISGKDEESNKENSNKDTRIIPTMRDYIAGFTCRELAEKIILPPDIAKAHKDGIIHVHDTDYSPAMPMNNCFARSTKFITDNGVKSFEDFNENDEIQVLTPSGNFRKATVKKYGMQNLNKITFKKGNSKPVEVFATENHRWILKDKKITTSLKIGDQLCEIKLPQEHTIQELIKMPEETGQATNYGTKKTTKTFRLYTSNHFKWEVQQIQKNVCIQEVWCLDVEDEHAFVLEHGIPTGNCCLINLEDMLQNGTVISGAGIHTPHSFRTACTLATQIITQVASSQYGGSTITLAHLAPFVNISRRMIEKRHPDFSPHQIESLIREEIRDGVQTIQYQLITMSTTNGQAPFVSIFMWPDEAPEGQTREDLVLIIEEVLRQRIAGIPNEQGYPITIAFPKLLYCLDEDNCIEGSKYWWLTELAAECSAKRLVPDYISAKKMRELKGDVFPCMGCRSFLAPDPIEHKYYGKFNQGVVTLNLVDAALSSHKNLNKFWEILDDRLELCHRALMIRHNSLLGTKSDVAPILWQHGAFARLQPGEVIDPLLFNNHSTISLGYAGLYECIKYMTGQSQLESDGKEFGLLVMQKLNDACNKWKEETKIGFSVYGSPIESTTYKFAKCLQKRFGKIKGITDKNYVTNSYHITPAQPIDAFNKLKIEAEFQSLSLGGAISYVECPNMTKNIPAVLEIIKYIYNNIMYAELNTMTSYCHICGCTDIYMGDDLQFHCPQCGNNDYNKMNVALRICGYISTNPFNDGRAADIHDRVYHID